MLTVVAAIIESDGKLLVCQRRRGSDFELLWEFPGGKKNSGETNQEALARELREELGIEARIVQEVYRTAHHYAELNESLELIFYAVQADVSAIQNRIFERIQWREPKDLLTLDFLPADRELIERIASGQMDKALFATRHP